jgi:MFS family permease
MTMPRPAPTSIFRNRSFVLFWSSRVCASIAVQMQSLAVGWQIYNLTDSAFDLGLVGLMQFLPLVSLMLVAGQVADRYDRRTIVQVSLAVTGASVAVLALATAAGWINRDLILVTILVFGSARAFQTPTTAALCRRWFRPRFCRARSPPPRPPIRSPSSPVRRSAACSTPSARRWFMR